MLGERPNDERRRERGTRLAVLVSLVVHAALVVAVLFFVALPEIPPAPPPAVEVSLVAPEATPAGASSSGAPRDGGNVAGGAAPTPRAIAAAPHAANETHETPASAGGAPSAPRVAPTQTPAGGEGGAGGGVYAVAPSVDGMIAEHFRRDAEAAGADPKVSGPKFGGHPDKPGHTASDQLDGIGELGSGEPGDPRIPGAAPVDIAAVLSRDAVVASAREHVAEGRVHPFLFDVKSRIEQEWDPSNADARVLSDPEKIPDPVCAAGYHLRFKVARVLAVYDVAGTRISFTIAGAPLTRGMKDRIQKAIDDAGMQPPPRDLIDAEGHLRVAWNVFVDSYVHCNLVGRDGRGKTAYGGAFTVGIVELDGTY